MNKISTLAVSTTSAAHITITISEPLSRPGIASTAPATSKEICTTEWFDGLREMLAECEGLNKNDKVDVLIAVCISDGVDDGFQIVGVVRSLGFNPRHAGKMLKLGTGQRWRRDEEGRYSLLS